MPGVTSRPFKGGAAGAALLFTLLAAAAPLPARQEPTTPIERELTAIRVQLEQIVQLLRDEGLRSDGQTLLRRIELKNQRLVPIEERLRRTRGELDDAGVEVERLRTVAKQFEVQVQQTEDEEQRRGMEQELERFPVELQRLRQRQQNLQAEHDHLDGERAQLVAEIDQLERELDYLEAQRKNGR